MLPVRSVVALENVRILVPPVKVMALAHADTDPEPDALRSFKFWPAMPAPPGHSRHPNRGQPPTRHLLAVPAGDVRVDRHSGAGRIVEQQAYAAAAAVATE